MNLKNIMKKNLVALLVKIHTELISVYYADNQKALSTNNKFILNHYRSICIMIMTQLKSLINIQKDFKIVKMTFKQFIHTFIANIITKT